MRDSWQQRQDAQKKAAAAKDRDVTNALKVVEALWTKCTAVDPYGRHAYTPAERKAINEACSKLRAVAAGWINERRR